MKSKKMPIVSIIIPFHNLGRYLPDTIKSCINQSYPHLEIIVINDGTDEPYSIMVLNKMKQLYKERVKFIDQRNRGVSAARNNGIKASSGDYVCCLDADDKIEPDYIKKAIVGFSCDEKPDIVTCWIRLIGERHEILKIFDFNPVKVLAFGGIPLSSVIKKTVWEKVGGYGQYMDGYEDWEFWVKAISHGFKWKLIEEPLIIYRQRKKSMVTFSNKKRYQLIEKIIDNNQNIYKKYYKQIIIELISYNDTILNTTGWKIIDKFRFFRNKISNIINI